MESRLFQNLLSTLLLLLLLPFLLAMASASLAFQGRALLQWKASLQSQGLPLQSWKPSASPCNWTGVSCNVTIRGGSVITEIYLSNTSLVGTLDALNFSALPSLTNLNLSFNQLNGTIPPTIATLFKLSSLDLTSNQLTGKIPFEIGSMRRLQSLNLSENQISGFIPPSLANLSRLNYLFLDSNSLSGTIPEELGRLRNLVFLKLADNLLTGLIPPSLGNLTRLYELALHDNKLSGPIPQELGNLVNLVKSGPIPEKLGDCFKLRSLKLSSNNLNGNIPFQIGNLVNLLDLLDMSHNSLTGDIPSQISKLVILQDLNLSQNELTGLVPPSLPDMISLLSIDLSYNELEGPLPDSQFIRRSPIEWFAHNKGLCGEVQGLPPCHTFSTSKVGSVKHRKVTLLATVPVLGTLFLLFLFGGATFLLLRRRNNTVQNASQKMEGGAFSIWNFDGKDAYEDIIQATDHFDDKHCIGTGAYGSVYKAVLPNGKIVAVKKIEPLETENQIHEPHFLNEIQALTRIRHRNIVKLYGFCSTTQHKLLMYEYMERGSLATILKSEEATQLDWTKRVNIIKDVAHALSYMHHDCAPAIVHRDITSNNILLDAEFKACVSNFGIARLLRPDSSNWSMLAGTRGYVAPGKSQFY